MTLRERTIRLLRATERYTRTDMVYLASTGFWSNLGTILVSGGSLLLYIVFSRYVSKETYGMYQYLLSLGAIVGSLALGGMNTAVTRAVARGQEGALAYAVRLQLFWGLLQFLGTAAVGAYYLFHGNLVIGFGLVLIGIFVPINGVLNTYGGFLAGKKDFRRGFYLSLWYQLPYYALVALCAFLGQGALVLLGANLLTQCIGLFIAYRATIAAYHPNDVQDPDFAKYGGHLSAIGFLGGIVGQMDSILTFHFLGAANLALYSFATAIPDRLGSLFKFIPAAAFPKFAGRAPSEIRVGLARRMLIGTAAAIALICFYAVAARFVFAFLFPAYLSAVPYSQWYALALVTSMGGVLVNALTSSGNVRALYIYNLVSPLALLAFEFAGIMSFGLAGLVGARIAGSLFSFALVAFLYWRLD